MAVCIIGAGIAGLSTAGAIQERLPTCRVTIMADKFEQHTISYGSGGMICPFPPEGIPIDVGRQWCKDSVDYFYKLAFSSQASEAGVSLISGFQFSDNPQPPPLMDHLLNIKKLEESDLRRFGKKMKYGWSATAAFLEMPVYLKWITDRFIANGGTIIKRKIESLHELSGQFDVVVNCSGFGSRELVNDTLLRPIRGQTVQVEAPHVKNFVRLDASVHIFPFTRHVYLGAIKQLDNTDMTISSEDSASVLRRCQEIFPPLKGARVLWEWVGLRPQRSPIRVESEILPTQGKPLKVVHNYGHGSFGISLSHGCAVYASKMVKSLLTQNNSKL